MPPGLPLRTGPTLGGKRCIKLLATLVATATLVAGLPHDRPTHTLVQRRLLGNAVVVSRKRNSQAEPIHRPLRSTTIWKLRDRVSRRPVSFSSSRLMTRASSSLRERSAWASSRDVPSGI